ncbi:protein TIC 62, chloroplastic isoform X2 [Juglans microcarpa x Juglans regia]|uniref:protein TIC 62, chloroplastic isoform X2 n=1 Tax=Juglans microcarpa x Juglans regia TaxID=2249226 RepID=UPI001B7E8FDE|nr:protein TIC 62, chloroplastic isoform X2 [Juglans microcarpa x Juglans regia]
MEGCSLQSPALTTIPSSLFPSGFIEKPFVHGQVLKFRNSNGCSTARKLKFLSTRAQASAKVRSEAVEALPKKKDLKDDDLVFVAGATGRVGSRTVRELLKLGFRVRAGVRSAQKAETLVQSVKQVKLYVETASEGTQPVEKLEIVECDLEKQDQIGPALGNASVVICCIGASEKEVFDVTGPYRIDYLATKNLINAATIAKVKHFILLTSLGTNKVGFPAAILNLFWGVLIWKRKAEEALLASGLPYTIVRPGGMERPTDAYKETHNTTLSQEDTLFGGQVSNLQVAELMAVMAKNRSLSYCKVVEVIAETTAPITSLEELLKKIPSQRVDIYSPEESGAAGLPDSSPSVTVKSEEPSTPIKKESSSAKTMTAQPLSPYIVYEDLKPPSSPSPTPSGPKETPLPPSTGGNDVAKTLVTGVVEKVPPQSSTYHSSPYAVYDDLKPPTSPSPSAPTASILPTPNIDGRSNGGTLSVNNIAQSLTSDEPRDKQHHAGPKPRPLSPFTMYEDLKPPTSPIPSPRRS